MTDEYINSHYSEESLKDEMRKMLQHEYNLTMAEYKKASNESKRIKSDLKLKPYKYFLSESQYKLLEGEYKNDKIKLEHLRSDENTDIRCRAYEGDYIYNLDIYQYPSDSTRKFAVCNFTKSKYYFPNFEQCLEIVPVSEWGSAFNDGETVSCNLSEEEAIKYVNMLLKNLGMDDTISVVSISKETNAFGQSYYYVIAKRSVCGIVLDDMPEIKEGEEIRQPYNQEKFSAFITDDGIMQWAYEYPLKVQKIVNEGIGIKDFKEILNIYKKQSALTYDTIYDVTAEDNGEKESVLKSDSAKVSIDSIDFKLMRIAEKDKSLTYLLAPVWTFSGEITYFTSDNEALMSNKTSIMINAVDGSIINAADCY